MASPIIDCHVHLNVNGADLAPELLVECQRLGVGQIMVSSLGRTWDYEPSHEHCVQANDDTARVMQEHPGVVLGWAYVNPRFVDESRDEVTRRVCAEGFSGVKLWTAAHATEPCVDAMVDVAVELQVPLLIHAWHKATGNLPFESTPRMVAELSRRRPEAMIVMAHIGGDWELGCRALEDVAACVDVSGSIVEQGMIEGTVAQLGAHRVIFGSDSPIVDLCGALAKIQAAEVPEESRRLMLGGNIQAMLGRRSGNGC